MTLKGKVCPCCGRRLPETKEEKVQRLVDRSGGPEACHPYTGRRNAQGYGMVDVYERGHARMYRAHRLAYELAHGPLPVEAVVLHRCDNPACCNPAHLLAGTHAENITDMWEKGRQQKYERQARGERHGGATLTEAAVIEMRRRFAAGETAQALGPEYGVTQAAAWNAIHGVSWKHVPEAQPQRGRGRSPADRQAIGDRTRGARNGLARATEEVVREIRSLAASGVAQADLMRRFGLSRGQISKIVRRVQWAHLD